MSPSTAVRIALPAHWNFHTELPLYIEHINHGGHLDNARLLSHWRAKRACKAATPAAFAQRFGANP